MADTIDPNYISLQTSFNTSVPIRIQLFLMFFKMPTVRKQKSKSQKSQEAEMLSDLGKMDMMLGSDLFEREDSEFGYSARRPESPIYDALVDHSTNSHSNSGANEIRRFAGNGQNSGAIDSSSVMYRLLGELNQRLTQVMNGLINSVTLQIQRAISEAINEQVLPQNQASLMSGSGQMPPKGWNFPTERPEWNLDQKELSTARSEVVHGTSSPII